ncbi:MAG: hypothetical protein ACXWFG_14195 [Methylobacter sp.]
MADSVPEDNGGLGRVVCERFNWCGHAYCQMTTHYRLVLETPEGTLAQGLRQPTVFTHNTSTVGTNSSGMYFRGETNCIHALIQPFP